MPSATARRLYEDQIPSFMSVFDLGAETMDDQSTVTVVDPKIIGFPGSSFAEKQLNSHAHPSSTTANTGAAAPPSLSDPSHRHHDSTSTQMSESADSSPTTTMSCTDSSSLSDPSPSSSPDSPINLVPLAAFPGPSFGGFSSMSVGLASLSVIDPNNNSNNGPGLERPMTSPSPRRARNMKGLSIQPPFVSPTLSASTQISEPTSPSFIKPQIPAMKRKPSQLSLKTTTHELKATAIEVPQSPSLVIPPILQRRALKHSTSSPHILSSLKSSTFGPPGGMSFPTVLERNESGLSEFLRPSKPAGPTGFDATILEEESPIRAQIANRAAYEFEPYHEVENNEDQKTPGYPDGPIAIYDDNVYLYLEPTAEEASRFDVVINVAREVNNPFKFNAAKAPRRPSPPPPRQQRQPSPPQLDELRISVPKLTPIMEPVMEQDQEATPATEDSQQTNGSIPMVMEPTTIPMVIEPSATSPEATQTLTQTFPSPSSRLKRKAPALSLTLAEPTGATDANNEDNTPTTPKATQTLKEPEYIHIPWDHNTDIGQDLMTLCETIDKRTKDGKKVLIHCQQGASRSASLIIAYGMYQNPELSVNDSYYAAQAKSRWISPNMRLMYCLQDFQKEVGKRRASTSGSWLRPGRSPTKHRAALSMDAIEISPKEPLSAPLPAEDSNGSGSAAMRSPERSPMRPRGNSTPNSREAISPGPSSAPSSFSWDEKEDENDPQRFGRFDFGFTSTALQPPKLNPPPMSQGFGGSGGLTLPGAGNGMGGGGFMRPPPSPGFAAHRFGEFPDSSRSNPSSSGFPLLSPGFPPPRSSCSDGLDSILARNMGPSFAPINFSNPIPTKTTTTTTTTTTTINAPPAPTFKTSFFNLPSISVKPSPVPEQTITVRPAYVEDDEPLMSPRAETMTNNPLHDQLHDHQPQFSAEVSSGGDVRFVEVPPTPGNVDDKEKDKELSNELFSPRETMFPRDPFFPFGRPPQVDDPRSPPTKGETPIVRSIDEFI
ncbi:tyrosine/serine/threonine protein phosphatase [Sporothrix stenoceras]|uniref:protein-tyrosine-phosphatase n=1 Tax=Sporothrix stenoceras TaxID=5173 RepID=A0ABR3YN86_9PEZI